MQWSIVWTGETLDSRVWHNGGLFAPKSFTPGECQDLCLQSVGCVGFNWFPNMNCTLITKLGPEQVKVKGAVSGHPSCKGKGKDTMQWLPHHRGIVAKSVFDSGNLFFEAEFS